MWWSLLLVAGSISVVILTFWRVGRYQRDLEDGFEGEFRPPIFHDRVGPH
jgi:hypothetical protein